VGWVDALPDRVMVLFRRRRGKPWWRSTACPSRRSPRSSAAPRSRTCSSSSPAARWSTDPVQLWRALSYWMTQYRKDLARHDRDQRPRIRCSSSPASAPAWATSSTGMRPEQTRQAVSYLAFFAPGLLAASAMQTGFIEGSGRVVRWRPAGRARTARPSPRRWKPSEIMGGHLLFHGLPGTQLERGLRGRHGRVRSLGRLVGAGRAAGRGR